MVCVCAPPRKKTPTIARVLCRTDQGLPESRLQFLSGLAGGVAAVALPLAALADPPLELFKAGEVGDVKMEFERSGS